MSRIQAFVLSSVPERTGTPRRKRGGRAQLTPVEVALDDAERRAKSGEWDDASGKTLVGLYAFCHKLVYGIVPDELKELPQFRMAAKQAAGCVHNYFDDDFGFAAGFVKWAWEREKKKDLWARQNGITVKRLSWRFQFSSALVTDWKVQKSRDR
jgi:hypothetical protein